MAIFHVQRQCWQRWPRVLIVERKGDNGEVDNVEHYLQMYKIFVMPDLLGHLIFGDLPDI